MEAPVDRLPSRLKDLSIDGRAELLRQFGPPGEDGYAAADIFACSAVPDQDRLLLLLWPETVGADNLLRFVEDVVGTEPCCKKCVGKESPRTRRTYGGALFSIRCHLRRDGIDPAIAPAAMIEAMRRILASPAR